MIPFLDLPRLHASIAEEIDDAVHRVVRSGQYILGEEVEAFEREFAAYCGVRHCIGVANGLDALRLSLTALGIGSGDEVIVPSNTFIATWLAVTQVGATPVPVEPDPATYCITTESVAAAITARTKAIIPVHLYGEPADLEPLLALAREFGAHVLEDAAQAHGARYRGRVIGSGGSLAAWSFYPGKNLGALGDAGAITTGDDKLADRIRKLGNYGSNRKYHHELVGFNSRIDPVQAAVLRVKLRKLDEWNDRRRAIAVRYLEGLAATSAILPTSGQESLPAWHLFVIRHARRDELALFLEAAGVGTVVHYPTPPHLQQAYSSLGYGAGTFPIAEAMANEVLSLPMSPALLDGEVDAVCELIRDFESKSEK